MRREYEDKEQRLAICYKQARAARTSEATTHAIEKPQVRFERQAGMDFVVLPMVLMTEGVRHATNSEYPEFVPAHEIEAAVALWDGQPVTLSHPRSGDVFVSASTKPGKQFVIGHVENARVVDGRRLIVDAWINLSRLSALVDDGPDETIKDEAAALLERITERQQIEVSAGYFTRVDDGEAGTFEGTEYRGVQMEIDPDHAAILQSFQQGACSWADGCGAPRMSERLEMRLNEMHETRAAVDGHTHYYDPRKKGKTSMTQGHQHEYDPEAQKTEQHEGHHHEFPPKAYALSTARTPSYSGKETTSWAGVDKSFAAFARGYLKSAGSSRSSVPSSVSDAPLAMKRWIASKTLLGDPAATSTRDLIFFPVVNPSTGKLNEGALRSVLGGRGAQASVSAGAKESARNTARRLLNKEFGTDLKPMEIGCACDLLEAMQVTDENLRANVASDFNKNNETASLGMVTDNYVVFEEDGTLFSQPYFVTGNDPTDGENTLTISWEEPYRVIPSVTFEKLPQEEDLRNSEENHNNQNVRDMTQPGGTMSEETKETKTEEAKPEELKTEATPEVKPEPVVAQQSEPETVIESDAKKYGVRLYLERRQQLISALGSMGKESFKPEDLEGKTYTELERLYKFGLSARESAPKPKAEEARSNFSGVGLPGLAALEEEGPPLPDEAFSIGSKSEELLRKGQK